MEPTLAFVVDC